MARQPFVGSGRPIEGGKLVTARQDFASHITGGAFGHTADQILLNPQISQFPDPTVQGTLSKIGTLLQTAGSYVSVGADGYELADYTVGTSGIPNLETALNLAFTNTHLQAGGVILIKSGTYVMTTRVTVPAGITILGENRGTVIIGNMSEQPMFMVSRGIQAPSIGNGQFLNAGSPLDSVRFIDIVLADNFNNATVDGTGPIPTMRTVPMIECEIGSRLECEQVSFIGKVGLTTFSGTPATKCAIGYTSGAATGTHLVTTRCYFDGFGTAIQFNPGSGINDYLTIEGCRARTFGNDTDTSTKSNNCFAAFTLCNTKFVDNYYIASGSCTYCFVQLSSTISGTYPRVVIMGNTGGVNGGAGFLLGDFTEQMYSVINNNSFGNDFSPSWYITVGDGISNVNNVGDINGQFALEAVLNNSGGALITNAIYIYVKGRSHIVRKSLTQSSARLIGVKIDKSYPLITLDLTSSSVLDEISRKTLLVGNYVSDIEFVSTGTGFKSLELTWGSAFGSDGQVRVENCYFRNVGLTVQKLSSMNSVVDLTGNPSKNSIEITNSIFNQTGAYTENVSLLIPETNNILLSGCSFRGAGYVGLIGTLGSVYTGFSFPGSANTQKTNQITIENCEMDLSGNIITNNSPLPLNSYFIIQSSTANISFYNTRILADNTFSPVGFACLPSTATSFCNISGLSLSFENCMFNGPTQTYTSSSVVYALPTLFLSPKQSLYVNNCRVLYGSFPIQISGSGILSTDPLYGINISKSEFLTTGMCALDIDTRFDTLITTDQLNAVQPKITIEGNTFQNNTSVGSGVQRIQHTVNTGSYYDTLGIVQVYGCNCDVSFINNYVSGRLNQIGAIGSPYVGYAGLAVNNYDSPAGSISNGITIAPTKISKNSIQVDNRFESTNDNTYATNMFIKSPYLNVANNIVGMLNDADTVLSPSNFTSFMVINNIGPTVANSDNGGIVIGNNFRRLNNSLSNVSKLKKAAIYILNTQLQGGMFVDNSFNSPFLRDDSTAQDSALFVSAIPPGFGNWLIERNVNQTDTVAISSASGNYSVALVLSGSVAPGIIWTQPSLSFASPPGISYTGGTEFTDVEWEIPISSEVPKNAYITNVSMQVSASVAFDGFANIQLSLNSKFPVVFSTSANLGPSYTAPNVIPMSIALTSFSDLIKVRNIASNIPSIRLAGSISSTTNSVITFSNFIITYRW